MGDSGERLDDQNADRDANSKNHAHEISEGNKDLKDQSVKEHSGINADAVHLLPEGVGVAEFLSNGLVYLSKEISRQPNFKL